MFGSKKNNKKKNLQDIQNVNKKFVIPQITESFDGLKTEQFFLC